MEKLINKKLKDMNILTNMSIYNSNHLFCLCNFFFIFITNAKSISLCKAIASLSPWYSKTLVSTIESTGQDSSQNRKKYILLNQYRTLLFLPSSLFSDSIVIAIAGHTASQSLHATHLLLH